MSGDTTDIVVAYVTAPVAEAPRLARALVERSLAACVNVLPEVRSVYRWRGDVQEEAEALLIIKTTRSGFDALVRAVRELHPYEVPEVIALPVQAGHAPYLDWVRAGVAPSPLAAEPGSDERGELP